MTKSLKKIAWQSIPKPNKDNARTVGPEAVATPPLQDTLEAIKTNLFGLRQLHQAIMDGGLFAVRYRQQYANRDQVFQEYLDTIKTWEANPDPESIKTEVQNLAAQLQGDQVRLEALFLQAAGHSDHTYNDLRLGIINMGYQALKSEAEASLRELEVMQLNMRQLLQQATDPLPLGTAVTIINLYNQQQQYEIDIAQNIKADQKKADHVAHLVACVSGFILGVVGLMLGGIAWWKAQGSWIILKDYTLLGIPSGVLVWSLIGSVAALVHRFYKGSAYAFNGPVRWVLIRPTMGMFTAAVVYMALYALFVREGENFHPYVSLLLAFFVGYSDKFSLSLMKSVQNALGAFFKEDASETPPATDPPAAPASNNPTPPPAAPPSTNLPVPPTTPPPAANPVTPPAKDPNAGEDEDTASA